MTLDDVSTTELNYEPDFNLLISHEIVDDEETAQPVANGIVRGQLSLMAIAFKFCSIVKQI